MNGNNLTKLEITARCLKFQFRLFGVVGSNFLTKLWIERITLEKGQWLEFIYIF